jgi:hypothetical protein
VRYGSDYARAWSRRLRFGDVRAKSVLNAICNYVDENGHCFPSIGTLADDTDQSVDSVRRRLQFLERVGVLVRFGRWYDDHGKVNQDGRGRRTSDEIRLIFDARQEDIDAAIAQEAKRPDGEADPSQQQGSADPDPGPLQGSDPSQQQGGPSLCGEGLKEPSPKQESPQSPPCANGVGAESESEFEQAWQCFVANYPIPIGNIPLTRHLLKGLSEEDRSKCLLAATGYRLFVKLQERRAMDAHRFIRDGRWVGYVDAGRAAQPKPPPKPTRDVSIDSPEGRAIVTLFRIAGGIPDYSDDKRFIRLRVDELGPQALALVGAPHESEWELLEFPAQWAAWSEFLRPIIGRSARVKDHVIEARTVPNPNGGDPIFIGNVTKRGLKAPWPWPPRKDGTLSTTGPPGHITDHDAREFTGNL